MKTLEPAMNIEEQIDNLKEIGLIIDDIEYAKSFLNDVSYFRLIKAYSLGLKPKILIIIKALHLRKLFNFIFLMLILDNYYLLKLKNRG